MRESCSDTWFWTKGSEVRVLSPRPFRINALRSIKGLVENLAVVENVAVKASDARFDVVLYAGEIGIRNLP